MTRRLLNIKKYAYFPNCNSTNILMIHGKEDIENPKKKSLENLMFSRDFGPSDWILTSGLLVPNQAHYQAVPHPDMVKYRVFKWSGHISVFIFGTDLQSTYSARSFTLGILSYIPFFVKSFADFLANIAQKNIRQTVGHRKSHATARGKQQGLYSPEKNQKAEGAEIGAL